VIASGRGCFGMVAVQPTLRDSRVDWCVISYQVQIVV
jgi:hypothetical protein